MIRLKNLDVSNFRGIKSAQINFSTGLNVLYGDNEIGKSSLVAAIRAAFLLPATSSEAKEYQTWGAEQIPTVLLKFEIEEVSFQVQKKFASGSKGSATLHRLKGDEFFHVAKGRVVDGELRKLLAWGIPEPGGRGAPRGLPESYLTKALLGFQEDVESILVADIEKDKTESGRRVLTEALGAFGQEPIVTSLLDQLTHRASKVFTPSGQLKKTQDSPLFQKTLEFTVREHRLQDLTEQLQKGENVEESLRELSENAKAARAALEEIERLRDLATLATSAEKKLQESLDEIIKTDQARKEYEHANTDAESLHKNLRAATDEYEKSAKAIQELETELAKLQAKLASLQETDANTMEEKRKTLDAEIQSINNEITRINLIKHLTDEVKNLSSRRNDADELKQELTSQKTLTEHQLNFSQLQEQREDVLQKIKQHDETVKKIENARAELESAQKTLNLLQSLVTNAKRGSVIRSQLDDIAGKQQEIESTNHKQEVFRAQIQTLQRQHDDIVKNCKTNQSTVDDCVAQLATFRGEQNALVNSAESLAESKTQELHSQIAVAEQVITQAKHVIASSEEAKKKQEEINSICNQESEKLSLFQQAEIVLQHAKASEVITLSKKIGADRDLAIELITAIKKEIDAFNSELGNCNKQIKNVQDVLSSLRKDESRSSALLAELNSIQSEKLTSAAEQQKALSILNKHKQLEVAEESTKTCQQNLEFLQGDIDEREQARESLATNISQLEQASKKQRLLSLQTATLSTLAGIIGPAFWVAKILAAGVVIGPLITAVGLMIAYVFRSRSKNAEVEAKDNNNKRATLNNDIREAKNKLKALASQLENAQAECKQLTDFFVTSPTEAVNSAKSVLSQTESRISELATQENELNSTLEKLSKGFADSIPKEEQELEQLSAKQSTIRENISEKQIALREKETELSLLPTVDSESLEQSRALLSEHESRLTSEEKNLGSSTAQEKYDEASDNLQKCKQAHQVAERELHSLTKQYNTLLSQLDVEPEESIISAKQDIQKAQSALASLSDQHDKKVQELNTKIEFKKTKLDEFQKNLIESKNQLQELEKEQESIKEQLNKSEAAVEQMRNLLPEDTVLLESELAKISESLHAAPNIVVDIENHSSFQSFQEKLNIEVDDAEESLTHWRNEFTTMKAILGEQNENNPQNQLTDINSEIETLLKLFPNQELAALSVSDAKAALTSVENKLSEVTTKFQQLCGQEEAKQSELMKQKKDITQPLDELLTDLVEIFREKTQQRDTLQKNNSQQKSTLSDQLKDIEARLPTEQKVLENKTRSKDEFIKKHEEAQKKSSEAQGILRQLEKQTDKSSRESAKANIRNAVTESQGQLTEGQPFAKQLEKLNNQLEIAKRNARNRDKELQMSRGQLELIGGSVLRDKINIEEEFLQKLQEEATEFEEQCNAEKYLLDILTESNDQHSAHLGRMLADPVSKTFSQLTENRYGTFMLDPALTVRSVKANGDHRGYQSLSVGTRHQLAVLVRLALAAHLKATLLLDDQLVQSDSKRLAWFRKTLSSSTKNHNHQIIVITCRPDDYGLSLDANSTTSYTDLTKIIERQQA